MNDARLWAVITKEWLEMRRNRMIMASMVALPLILALMAIGSMVMYVLMPATEFESDTGSTASLTAAALSALSPQDAMIIQSNDMMMFMLLMVPVILPSYIAAHSIIGEKDGKSLEPLLATPLTTAELLLGKTIAYVTPAAILGWATYLIVAVYAFFGTSEVVFAFLVRPVWTVGMALMSPLLALLGTLLGVLVSARSKDPRVAQQLSGVFVLPLVGLSMVAMFGKIFMSLDMLLWASSILVVLAGLLLWLAVKLFQRETILTRWK